MKTQQGLDGLTPLRRTGHGGGIIQMHRAMRTEYFSPMRWAWIIGFPLLCNLLTLKLLPEITGGWFVLTRWSIAVTGSMADVSALRVQAGWMPPLVLPWLELSATTPSFWQSWANALAALLLLLLSFVISPERMPARYALRLVGIIQACSCLYFVLMPAAFSHSLPDYFHTCLKFVLLLLFLVPWIHALTFYILDKPNWHKVLLTLLSLTYIYLEAPLHYFAAALLLHFGSLLFMPLLFILGSLMVEVLLLIALYGWVMSWEGQPSRQAKLPGFDANDP